MNSGVDTLSGGIGAAIAALRARGGDQRDPVRFRFIEALAQRAANQHGTTRRLLEDKLAGLLAAYDPEGASSPSVESPPAKGEPAGNTEVTAEAIAPAAIAAVPVYPTPAAPTRVAGVPAPRVAPPASAPQRAATGPLAALVHQLAERSVPAPARPSQGEPAASPRSSMASAASPSAPPELKALSYFRSTWSRLSTEQRLAQSAAKLPENAGPLNSQHLVHQSLVLMRELSPGYLERFIAHVDALLWLDQLNGTASK